MEFPKQRRLNNMKLLLVLFLVLLAWKASAQDTLYLKVHGLGHEKYILKENRTFIYNSSLCGSTFVSFGTYKKNFFGYKFSYDTTLCPTPSISGLSRGSDKDSITIFFHNMVDNSLQPFFGSIIIGGQVVECDTNYLAIFVGNLNTDDLILKSDYMNELIFALDSISTTYHIYLTPLSINYKCGVNDIHKLKKRREGYLNKFAVYDEIREKPWKKGRKRIVKQYYQITKRN